jgi:hypothetical protein
LTCRFACTSTKLAGARVDTCGMHTILRLAKRFGIGQQRVGGAGLLVLIVVGIPAIVIIAVKLAFG